jgi:hypothetical protein
MSKATRDLGEMYATLVAGAGVIAGILVGWLIVLYL